MSAPSTSATPAKRRRSSRRPRARRSMYVAYEPPAPKGEAILVPKDSPLKTVADLKGKKVALNKGSNVHYLLVEGAGESRRQILRDRAGVSGAGRCARGVRARRGRCLGDLGSVPGRRRSRHRRAHARRRHRPRRQLPVLFLVARSSLDERSEGRRSSCWRSCSEVDDWAKGDIQAVAEQLGARDRAFRSPCVEVALEAAVLRHQADRPKRRSPSSSRSRTPSSRSA